MKACISSVIGLLPEWDIDTKSIFLEGQIYSRASLLRALRDRKDDETASAFMKGSGSMMMLRLSYW